MDKNTRDWRLPRWTKPTVAFLYADDYRLWINTKGRDPRTLNTEQKQKV